MIGSLLGSSVIDSLWVLSDRLFKRILSDRLFSWVISLLFMVCWYYFKKRCYPFFIISKRRSHLTVSLRCFNKFQQNWKRKTWRNASIIETQWYIENNMSSINKYSILLNILYLYLYCIFGFILKPKSLSFTCSYSLSFVSICCTTLSHLFSFVIRWTIRCPSLSFFDIRCHSF